MNVVLCSDEIVFDNLPSAQPFIKAGRLISIVIEAPQRLPKLPTAPTFKEVGLEPVNRKAYQGIVDPKGLPKAMVDKGLRIPTRVGDLHTCTDPL